MAWVIPTIGTIAVVTVWGLAALIARQDGTKEANRSLAFLLVAEGIFLVHVVMLYWPGSAGAQAVASATFGLAAGVLPWLYLRILAPLDTPFAAWLRSAGVRRATAILPLLTAPLLVLVEVGRAVGVLPSALEVLLAPVLLLYVAVLAFALVCAVLAFRRAERGTPVRAKARAFVLAFGVRDVLLIAAIVSSFTLGPGRRVLGAAGAEIPPLLGAVAAVLYAALLAYGILRTQLFDIDLRVKVGIRRSTVVTMVLVVALGAAKVAEFYLNKTYGLVAGGIAAGAMLVLTPRLNRMGEKVANTAMPQVQPTPVYLQFKKLEVYRAAVEAAQETGGIGPRERAGLDRLRDKLGLAAADCAAVEAELQPAARVSAAPAAGA
ncbi:MAG TPA: hypothetical protein VM327_05040 [Candidatus Thermoplasmatota archaeon]|nr:hypothetical protein [Candidatus Thermoplasmatota archaeon]